MLSHLINNFSSHNFYENVIHFIRRKFSYDSIQYVETINLFVFKQVHSNFYYFSQYSKTVTVSFIQSLNFDISPTSFIFYDSYKEHRAAKN